MKSIISVFILVASVSGWAAEPTYRGAWHLDRWLVRTADGAEREFCRGANGILMYGEAGYVSTSINCPKRGFQPEPADGFQRVFFYAGTYHYRNGVIYKDVTNATYLPLIGKTVLRKIEKLTEDELILSGPFGAPGNSLWIRWIRK